MWKAQRPGRFHWEDLKGRGRLDGRLWGRMVVQVPYKYQMIGEANRTGSTETAI